METTVTRKGQVTIPAELRKKYGIREGMKMEVIDEPKGLVFRPVPHMNDWAGADAGKYSYSEMTQKLDRLRKKCADARDMRRIGQSLKSSGLV